ncbi:hypothetical protein GLOIN_2v1836775 [Rhizophagus clarus]|uniref:Ion transport domain-containing protein n=1 Tax=Rhizophagus clarus TaxID=94130 RepID=A0A8H3LAL3_9GLOM|nr:hypothetical protein GLOIN_2v1836775 [Rhizophagus clarus]
MSEQHTTVEIGDYPHNGMPITKIVISPLSRYVVTYSQEDKSFVGWCSKNKKNPYIECIKKDINPFIGSFFGNKENQDDESNDDNDSESLIVDNKVQPYKLNLDISDYKVSDKKIIMYESNDESAIIYDMKNKKEITLISSLKNYADDKHKFKIPYYKFTNFLTNGDLATYNIIESKGFKNQTISRKHVILIYSSSITNSNGWKCKSKHELDVMNALEINFGGITNDTLWMPSKNAIILLDLFTFQYRQILLETDEKVDIKKIELNFLQSLIVISIQGNHYIYSDRVGFQIKTIVGSNSENSIKFNEYNDLVKSFFETNDIPSYFDSFNNIQLRPNNQKAFGIFHENPRMINMKKYDLETYIINIDSEENNNCKDSNDKSVSYTNIEEKTNNSKYSNDKNIFYKIEKELTTTVEDEIKLSIENYIIPNSTNTIENQNGYDKYNMKLKVDKDDKKDKDKKDKKNKILEVFISNSPKRENVSSYNIKSESWKEIKELRIYISNTEFEKTKLQYCYDIKFLECAIKLYNNKKLDALKIEEIKEIAQPTDNDELKKQWILYAISKKYFLTYYGEDLLKSAIKQNNIDLIELIYSKILKYFKEDPKNNIYILSILCKNMPYLNQNYPEFLSRYYNEMNLFADYSNSSMIHNDLHHLYSYCNELQVHEYAFIYYFLHGLDSFTFKILRIFSILKPNAYRLVLFLAGIKFVLNIVILTGNITSHAFFTLSIVSDTITIIILSIRKMWKSRPKLVFLFYTIILSLTFFNDDIIIIYFFRKYLKSQTQLMIMICISLISNSASVDIMILMNIFSRKYCKSHPILVFLIYIVGILSLIICVIVSYFNTITYPGVISYYFIAISRFYEIFVIISVLMVIKYFESQLIFPILAICGVVFSIFYVASFAIPILILFISFIIYNYLVIIFFNVRETKPKLRFIVPFPSYVTYSQKYNWFKELLIKPQSSPFSRTHNNELYKTWNGEAIINFKWRVFGRYYYAAIWILFIIYLTCFTLASIPYDIFNMEVRKILFIFSIILGLIHLLFEVRQFIWSPTKWISDIWNLFDLSAYLVPVLTSIYWISSYINGQSTEYAKAISISCLLLDIKFLLFFRAFESFGIYFAIIIGVAKRVISFLFIILIILVGFAHAFFILLEPKSNFSESERGNLNDSNNPWLLTKQYHQITENGNITPKATLIEEPDNNTNLFSNYPNSLLSMYLFLTGDRNSLSAWTPNDNPLMITLMIVFSFVVVVYLMNLFIGLLNMAIEADNDRASYLAQKALILTEIELFYLFPHQRRWKTWFPDIIYYYADVDKTRQTIKKLENEESWGKNYFPEMRKNLVKLAFGN